MITINILTGILLQEAQPQGGNWSFILMMIAIFAIMYFMMIRPQNKRQKKIREERAKLAKGSRVITQGGIIGRVADVKEAEFIIEIAPGVKINVDKNCVYAAGDADAVKDAANNQ